MAKLLILGGSGFVGRRLIAHLGAHHHRIHAVVRSEASAMKVKSAFADAITLDARDMAGERYQRVINLVVDYGRAGASLSDLVRGNLLYPIEVIESTETEAVINVSSALPQDYSDYALTKKMLERGLDRLATQRAFRNVNVHLHNIYGPGSHEANFVATLIDRMRRSAPIEVSSLRNSRDFVYIDDVVAALDALLTKLDRIPQVTAVDVGSGRPTQLRELVRMIQAKTGSNSKVLFGARPDNPREPSVLVADLGALTGTGWAPAHSLDQGLDATIRFMAQEAEACDQSPLA